MSNTQVKVSEIPDCDVCKIELEKKTPAYADASIRVGTRRTWAYVCKPHFESRDGHLGLGRGQELVKSDD